MNVVNKEIKQLMIEGVFALIGAIFMLYLALTRGVPNIEVLPNWAKLPYTIFSVLMPTMIAFLIFSNAFLKHRTLSLKMKLRSLSS